MRFIRDDGSMEQSYPLYEGLFLESRAIIDRGRVKVSLAGPLSKVPSIRSAIDIIDGQIPAKIGEKLFLSTWLPPAPSTTFDRFVESKIKSILGKRTPDQVTISITEECPSKCVHCALPDSGNRLQLDTNLVKNIINQVLDLGTTLIIFDGGEPALYPKLPELVKTVDDRAISTMFTSGAGFVASLAEQLKDSGLYAVNISLDSPVPEEHDAMRGRKGAYQAAMNAVENALEAGLLVDIYVVLRHENVFHLRSFHELALKIGAHELTFFEVVPIGRWLGRTDVVLSNEDHEVLQKFINYAEAPRIFSIPSALKKFGCFGGRNWMHINPDGEVYPCACFPQSFGNIRQESLRKIWRRMGSFPVKGRKICPMRI